MCARVCVCLHVCIDICVCDEIKKRIMKEEEEKIKEGK